MNSNLTDREYFGSYLTGLFETCGSISIRKHGCPLISLSFHIKNKALVEAIKERIGYGSIYKNRDKNISYQIFNKEGLLKFIEMTQKYLRTPKIKEYNNMIEYLNIKKNCNLSLAEIDESSFDTNAWLSGYLEISGSFDILTKTQSNRYYFDPKFTLTHKKIDKNNNSYEPFLQSLAAFLNTPLQEKQDGDKDCFLIRLFHSTYYLVNYLHNYPLFGCREYTFNIFHCVYDLWTNSDLRVKFFEGKTREEYIQSIETLKDSMNKEIPEDYTPVNLQDLPRYD